MNQKDIEKELRRLDSIGRDMWTFYDKHISDDSAKYRSLKKDLLYLALIVGLQFVYIIFKHGV